MKQRLCWIPVYQVSLSWQSTKVPCPGNSLRSDSHLACKAGDKGSLLAIQGRLRMVHSIISVRHGGLIELHMSYPSSKQKMHRLLVNLWPKLRFSALECMEFCTVTVVCQRQ